MTAAAIIALWLGLAIIVVVAFELGLFGFGERE